jgi:hypothetical protein
MLNLNYQELTRKTYCNILNSGFTGGGIGDRSIRKTIILTDLLLNEANDETRPFTYVKAVGLNWGYYHSGNSGSSPVSSYAWLSKSSGLNIPFTGFDKEFNTPFVFNQAIPWSSIAEIYSNMIVYFAEDLTSDATAFSQMHYFLEIWGSNKQS